VSARLIAAIRDFTRTISSPYDRDELLDALIEHACRVLDASGVGIMLRNQAGVLQFAVASDDRVAEAERYQDRAAAGACFTCFQRDEVIVVPDLRAEGRWGGYTDHVRELGFHALMVVPMSAGGQTIGVLDIYRDLPSAWSGSDLEAGEILAAMGAAYISNAAELQASITLSEQLQHALDARVVIEQAKGALLARDGIGPREAHEQMRTRARATNRRLVEVANEVLTEFDVDQP
jgi:GAF domain-containing protein